MPIYEYQCERCDQRTEALQTMDEPALVECPSCGGPLRKLMSAPAFQFKGTGWYVTDYGSKKGRDESSASSDSTGSVDETSSKKDGKETAAKPDSGGTVSKAG